MSHNLNTLILTFRHTIEECGFKRKAVDISTNIQQAGRHSQCRYGELTSLPSSQDYNTLKLQILAESQQGHFMQQPDGQTGIQTLPACSVQYCTLYIHGFLPIIFTYMYNVKHFLLINIVIIHIFSLHFIENIITILFSPGLLASFIYNVIHNILIFKILFFRLQFSYLLYIQGFLFICQRASEGLNLILSVQVSKYYKLFLQNIS